MTLKVFRCRKCNATLFPSPYFCAVCGGADWEERAAERGTISEVTVVRHRAGVQEDVSVYLASVVTSAGPIVIARLDRVLPADAEVSLEIDGASRILARSPA